MENQEAKRIIRDRNVSIGPDDHRSYVEIAEFLLSLDQTTDIVAPAGVEMVE